MATLSRSPSSPLPFLCSLIFILLLIPTTAAQAPPANITSKQLDSPFVRPLPLVRQSSPNCPCTCSRDNPKEVNLCAGAPRGCMVVRCFPRTFGFSCCDGRRIPDSPRTPMGAVPGLTFISMNARTAVQENPTLSRMADTILRDCVMQLAGLLDDPSENQLDSEPSRIVLPTATVRQRRRARIVFEQLIRESTNVLNFIISRLTIHLRG